MTAMHELILVREFDAPREKIFKAWTDPELMKEWFVPRPWTISDAKLDVRCAVDHERAMRTYGAGQRPIRVSRRA